MTDPTQMFLERAYTHINSLTIVDDDRSGKVLLLEACRIIRQLPVSKAMDPDRLVAQVTEAAEKAVGRFHVCMVQSGYQAILDQHTDILDRAIVIGFLSGISQSTNFLIANDGGVHVQQLQAAVKTAGEQYGLTYGPPQLG